MDLRRLPLDALTISGVWSALDADTRRRAARAVYEGEDRDRSAAVEADAAISRLLRFRLVAVRRLPAAKRADYLLRIARPDESLVSTLLRSLHLGHRRELLSAFLDALAIPHDAGVIDPDFDVEANRPQADRLDAALSSLAPRFPPDEIDLYAVTLLALDSDFWGPLAGVLRERWSAAAGGGGG